MGAVRDSVDQKIDSLDQKLGTWKMWAIGTLIAVLSTIIVTLAAVKL